MPRTPQNVTTEFHAKSIDLAYTTGLLIEAINTAREHAAYAPRDASFQLVARALDATTVDAVRTVEQALAAFRASAEHYEDVIEDPTSDGNLWEAGL
jgi:hypothetical protein